MKNITFTVVTLIIIGLCIIVGYFALTWMKNPVNYATTENDAIGDMVNVGAVSGDTATPTDTTPADDVATDPYAELLVNLEKFKGSNSILKLGSENEYVGYVQAFLNAYLKQEKAITNKFDTATEADYKKFQADGGLPQTGQVGTQGTAKMIEWVKKQQAAQ